MKTGGRPDVFNLAHFVGNIGFIRSRPNYELLWGIQVILGTGSLEAQDVSDSEGDVRLYGVRIVTNSFSILLTFQSWYLRIVSLWALIALYVHYNFADSPLCPARDSLRPTGSSPWLKNPHYDFNDSSNTLIILPILLSLTTCTNNTSKPAQ